MRPGQAAPVFRRQRMRRRSRSIRFNEAGAGCPGIRRWSIKGRAGGRGFNEAGAGCPGIRRYLYLFELSG